MKQVFNNIRATRSISQYVFFAFLLLSSCFNVAFVDAKEPQTKFFVQLVAPKGDFGNIGGVDEANFNGMKNYFQQKNIPFSIYNPDRYFYIDTPRDQLFGDIGNFLQTSEAPTNIIWRAGHGTQDATGGWGGGDNVYNVGVDVGRQEYFAQTRQIADQLGKDVIIVDHSCGSGACVHSPISDSLGGHLKGVITLTGKGQSGNTGVLEELFRDGIANGGADGILGGGKDNKVTLGELAAYSKSKGYSAEFAGDFNATVTYESGHPDLQEEVCEVLSPAIDGHGVDDALVERMKLEGYGETIEGQKAKRISENKSGSKIYFFIPDATNIRTFLDGLRAGKPTYNINGLAIQPGPYGIGETILLDKAGNAKNGSAYFKIASGDLCTADPIHFNRTGGNGFGGGGNGGGSLGNLGSNPLLPLLMQGLLGQGLGGGQGGQNPYGNQNNPYNNPYTQRANCATQGTSPVCGTDGRSYTNICYLQQSSVQLRTYGVCPTVTPTPSPIPTTTPNPTTQVTSILNQLTTSGIPTSLIESLRNTISSILSSILSGGANMGETIIR